MAVEQAIIERFKGNIKSGMGAPFLVVGMLAMVILPLPPFFLVFYF